MRLLSSALCAAMACGAFLGLARTAPAAAAGEDGIDISPRRVGPGDVVTVRLDCENLDGAYVTSTAFGTVELGGERRVKVTVNDEPGRYRVRGMCERGGEWVPGEEWLTVEDDRGGHHRDHAHDRGHDHGDGGWGDHWRDHDDDDRGLLETLIRPVSEECRRFNRCEEDFSYSHYDEYGDDREYGEYKDYEDYDDDWPEGGIATGDGVTAMRAVGPMTSAAVGIGVVGAVAGGVALVRRRRRGR
ncbi:hypothetical protein HNP84_003894 [Thermocatellispora tengchongensis]|uniref:Gram-positive cocci surface proteins LPxTG domain-containing protein n=1 Tax=Thermocatellispora tengchongensis TaxID=1073253 RepID=A0A840P3A9_9ACTN|nr:hypothetical protein [Thermocatellispora tengchongensis]MBB5134168.1 hypothetical protein [Thermocatellispora tengchongensis]